MAEVDRAISFRSASHRRVGAAGRSRIFCTPGSRLRRKHVFFSPHLNDVYLKRGLLVNTETSLRIRNYRYPTNALWHCLDSIATTAYAYSVMDRKKDGVDRVVRNGLVICQRFKPHDIVATRYAFCEGGSGYYY